METQPGVWLLTSLLLAALSSTQADVKQLFFMVGGKLELRPAVSGPISSILWKHGGDMLAEWRKDVVDLTYYGRFDGRTTLNIDTGHVLIQNTSAADAGRYSLEVNDRIQDTTFDATVIEEVPQPSVWIQPLTCSPELDECTLRCDGSTDRAEPVTYSWREDDGPWEGTGKTKKITKTETTRPKTFSCQMENDVSVKESDAVKNPFFQESGSNSSAGIAVGVVLVLLLIVAAAVGVLWKKGVIGGKSSSHRVPTAEEPPTSPAEYTKASAEADELASPGPQADP